MKFEAPSAQEIAGLMDELGLELSAEDRSAYEMLLGGLFSAYATIDAAPDALPETAGGDRHYWRPSAEENPLNAWHVRTSVRTRDDGPLAGLRVALKDEVVKSENQQENRSQHIRTVVRQESSQTSQEIQ